MKKFVYIDILDYSSMERPLIMGVFCLKKSGPVCA